MSNAECGVIFQDHEGNWWKCRAPAGHESELDRRQRLENKEAAHEGRAPRVIKGVQYSAHLRSEKAKPPIGAP